GARFVVVGHAAEGEPDLISFADVRTLFDSGEFSFEADADAGVWVFTRQTTHAAARKPTRVVRIVNTTSVLNEGDIVVSPAEVSYRIVGRSVTTYLHLNPLSRWS